MEDTIYSVILPDGTEINDLTKNGDNYISHSNIDQMIFEDNCSPVVITGSDGSEECHGNVEHIQIQKHNDEYWIFLEDISEEKMKKIKMQSDIEYLAMMADIEL